MFVMRNVSLKGRRDFETVCVVGKVRGHQSNSVYCQNTPEFRRPGQFCGFVAVQVLKRPFLWLKTNDL